MREYPKINSIYKRDAGGRFLLGQFAQDEFAYLQDATWLFQEKVDGTNVRIMISPDRVIRYGGRTDDAQMPTFLLETLVGTFGPHAEKLFEQFPDGAVLYGEGYGAKIQKGGGNYRPDNGFALFDIQVADWWLKRPDVAEIATKFGLETAPTIGAGNLREMVDIARSGFKSRWGDFLAEGIIARPAVDLRTRAGHRVITKVKHRDFSKGVVEAATA